MRFPMIPTRIQPPDITRRPLPQASAEPISDTEEHLQSSLPSTLKTLAPIFRETMFSANGEFSISPARSPDYSIGDCLFSSAAPSSSVLKEPAPVLEQECTGPTRQACT